MGKKKGACSCKEMDLCFFFFEENNIKKDGRECIFCLFGYGKKHLKAVFGDILYQV